MAELARLAGLHPHHLYDIAAGRKALVPATRAKLRMARARIHNRQLDGTLELITAYRATLALSALAFGLDPAEVISQKPWTSANVSERWRKAALARRVAQYLMNTALGFAQAEVGRAAGMTRQAVSIAMREVEDLRDEAEFSDTLERLEQWVGAA